MRACIRASAHALVFLLLQATNANAISHQWSNGYGDGSDQTANSIALDPAGNVIISGLFDGSLNFGSTTLNCGTSTGLFLAKLDASGNQLWSKCLGNGLDESTNRFALDANSDILLSTDFSGTVNFGGGMITSQGTRDGIIAKFDSDGNHVWSRSFGGPSATVQVEAAGVDGAGNLIVVGAFTGTVDFGDSTETSAGFGANTFVAKFDPNGAQLLSMRYRGDFLKVTALSGDSQGDIVLTGYHGGTFDFGGGPFTSTALYNVFLVKLAADGSHVWHHTIGQSGLNYAYDLVVGGADHIVVTGHFNGPMDFGGGAINTAGGYDIFVAKFRADGSHMWSRGFGDAGSQKAFSVAVDDAGMVTIGGHFNGTVDFGGGPFTASTDDYCVAQFNPNGGHFWSDMFDVFSFGLPTDEPYSISVAANPSGELAFAGSFKYSLDCGGGQLTGDASWNVFAAMFGSNPTGIPPHTPGKSLLRAHPNPFNSQTTIRYVVPTAGRVTLRVYDVQGRQVRTLVDRDGIPGQYTARWDGLDDSGRAAASGVYILRLRSADHVETARAVLLK